MAIALIQPRKVLFLVTSPGDQAGVAAVGALFLSMVRREWVSWRPILQVVFETPPKISSLHRFLATGEHPEANVSGDFPIGWCVDGDCKDVVERCVRGVEVVVRLASRSLLIGDIEDRLDRVADTRCVAGVMASAPKYWTGDVDHHWQSLANSLGTRLRRTHVYSGGDQAAPLETRKAPFVPRAELLLFPAADYLELLAGHDELHSAMLCRFPDALDAKSAAWAVAVARHGLDDWALGEDTVIRFVAGSAVKAVGTTSSGAELVLDYSQSSLSELRDPFSSEENHERLMLAGNGSAVAEFWDWVRASLGDDYPFADPEPGLDLLPFLSGCCPAPASQETYRREAADHDVETTQWVASIAPDLSGDQALVCLRRSGLFDDSYYLMHNPDVAAAGLEPLLHYLECGEAQGRWPNAFFNPLYYLERHGQREAVLTGPLLDYILRGEAEGCSTQLFEPHRYLGHNPQLAGFVERPLFHYLRIGKQAKLPGVMNRVVRRHLAHFERTKRASPGALMRIKQGLVAQFGLHEGFAHFLQSLPLKDMHSISRKPITSQREFAQKHGLHYLESDAGGETFSVSPLPIVGEPRMPPMTGKSRALYVACVADAIVRGHSSFIETRNAALFDFEGDELGRFDSEFEFDHAVFHADAGAAWIIQPPTGADAPFIEEAFTLLSARSHAFGHWVWENLLKLVAARLSQNLPPVPVLIDADMNPSHRESLRWIVPTGTQIIEVANFATVQVGKLWYAPTPHFMTVFEKRNLRFKWDYLVQSGERASRLVRELNRLADAAIGDEEDSTGKLFLARRIGRHSHHVLVNHAQIEAMARQRGFEIAHPEYRNLKDQVRLVRSARQVVAPEGSATFLMLFARPGTRLCILMDPRTDGTETYASLFSGVDVRSTVLTGPIIREHDLYYEWADYEIDEAGFTQVLEQMDGEAWGDLPHRAR